MPLPPDLKTKIVQAYDASRRTVPPVADVAARHNRRRLASLSSQGGGKTVLNLAMAVVDAGEEAWRAVAPALEGDRAGLLELRRLAAPGLRPKTRRGLRRDVGLPAPRCQGTPEQQRYLRCLVDYARDAFEGGEHISREVQLRISRSMTSALGRCSYSGASRRITIAERLFRSGLEDVLWDTVRHELAHLVDQATRPEGRSDHGARWRDWARRFGARPERLCPPEDARRVERATTLAPVSLCLPLEVHRWLIERDAVPASDPAHDPIAGTIRPADVTGTASPSESPPSNQTLEEKLHAR